MATTTCITSSVTLEPGQPFVLPPGATIIGATDIDSITSSCVDLTSIETTELFILRVPIYSQQGSVAVGTFFEAGGTGHQTMIGHSVNGIDTYYNYRGGAGTDPNAIANYYGIPTGNSDSPVNNIEFLRVIQSQVPGIFSYNGLFTQDGSAYNGLFFFQIKALPSIANNLEVIFSATGENFLIAPDGSDPGAPYRIKFMKRSDVPTHFTLPPVL